MEAATKEVRSKGGPRRGRGFDLSHPSPPTGPEASTEATHTHRLKCSHQQQAQPHSGPQPPSLPGRHPCGPPSIFRGLRTPGPGTSTAMPDAKPAARGHCHESVILQRRILVRRPKEQKSDRLLESRQVLSEIKIRHFLKLPTPVLLIHDSMSALYEAPAPPLLAPPPSLNLPNQIPPCLSPLSRNPTVDRIKRALSGRSSDQ